MPGSEDDLEVKMRVSLDEEDIRRQVDEAERKVNGPPPKPKPPAPGQGQPAGVGGWRDIGDAIAKSIRDTMSKTAGNETFAAFGQFAPKLAGAFFAVKLLEELKDAIGSVIRNLVDLAKSLSRYSPELSMAFREMSVEMRKLAIDMARTFGPALTQLVKAITEITSALYYALKPILSVIVNAIGAWAVQLRMIAGAFRLFMRAIASAAWGLAKLHEMLVSLIAMVLPAGAGQQLTTAAKALTGAAQKWIDALNGNTGPASMLQNMLIRGLTEASQQKSPSVMPAGDRGTATRAISFQTKDERKSDGKSAAAGRVAVPAPAPRLANVITQVKNETKVNVESEQAVHRAMEEVRGVLTRAVMRVRDDQVRLANRLAGETVVDLVS